MLIRHLQAAHTHFNMSCERALSVDEGCVWGCRSLNYLLPSWRPVACLVLPFTIDGDCQKVG